MGLQRLKDGIGNFVKGNYWFGRTFTNRFFTDSRSGGIFDAAAGVGITYLAGAWTVSNVLAGVAAAMAITSAPFSAPVTMAVSTVFVILDLMMVGFGVGFLSAAYNKSGLPWPSTMFNNAKNAVSNGASNSAAFAKKVFKPLTSLFTKAASKPSGQAPKAPAPTKPIRHDVF